LHYNNNKKGVHKMDTLNRIRKEQEERRIAQRVKDKAIVEAMFSNNPRPLNNAYLLEQHEG
jgi:hypothetical protein